MCGHHCGHKKEVEYLKEEINRLNKIVADQDGIAKTRKQEPLRNNEKGDEFSKLVTLLIVQSVLKDNKRDKRDRCLNFPDIIFRGIESF
jgi:hypothetical protein